METTTVLQLSTHLILESHDQETGERVVFNNVTGRRVRLNKATMSLLDLMKAPVAVSDLLTRLKVSEGDKEQTLIAHLEMLLDETILIDQSDESVEMRESIALAAEDLVASQQITFTGVPSAKIDGVNSGAYVIYGAGIDFATTGKSGAKHGPAALRKLSGSFLTYDRDIFSGKCQGWQSSETGGMILRGADIQDIGNVSHILSEAPAEYYVRLQRTASLIAKAGSLPVLIGGDHSLTAPAVNGCVEHHEGPVFVIQFDAHTDLAEWIPGNAHHHGNVMRRMLHECPNVQLLQIGIRGFAGALDEEARRTTVTQATVDQGLDHVLAKLPTNATCYITLDTDVLDPSVAPGTGTPVPMGMQPRQLLAMLEYLAKYNKIFGLDVVELCPSEDKNDMTTSLMFHILMHTLGYIHEHQ